MLEDSDIEDLHCDELDSSSSSTHSSSDTETEPVVQPAKRSKAAGKQKKGQSSPFDFSSSYIPVSRNVPQNSQQPGPTNLGDVDNESDVLDIFQLFWTDATWQKFTDMTNLRAEQTLQANANDYYAKLWSPLTVDETKAFFAVRLSMEYAVIRPRYESYWYRNKREILFQTPGYRKYFTRDRFLGIWRFLHYVDEQSRDKGDKLYKVRPLIDELILASKVIMCWRKICHWMKVSFKQKIDSVSNNI